ncbi:glycosyltransferase [Maribellus comscasis]|uniref:Glycosyltransferase n=1 Tax=Maribellus comscasis TaxID=2681766 RepID=A0A6I6JXU6_9BACT|nr:glycosyltransferase family 4 protein [Maribellus comscasis]QGY46179.1 glycosyltransferase [Maribellus comscasis]
MNVLMFGWEFPPHISGGLGTACYGITKALSANPGINLTFVVPKAWGDEPASSMKLVGANKINLIKSKIKTERFHFPHTKITVQSNLVPYIDPEDYKREQLQKMQSYSKTTHLSGETIEFSGAYTSDLMTEIHNFSVIAEYISSQSNFDLIHAHDWLTFPAGIQAKKATGKPLVVHVHATDFDRSGGSVNPRVYEIEKAGMEAADLIITVSNHTAEMVVEKYGITPLKIKTVHNGLEPFKNAGTRPKSKKHNTKLITFLGRITIQKGPQYFVEVARKVLPYMNDVKFVMAGSGDMMEATKMLVNQYGLNDKFIFPGFLKGEQVNHLLHRSDLFIMPSLSEPFGLVPLEAMHFKVPVIISKQSGVSEVIHNAIKVDFWDTDAMADAVYGILNRPAIGKILKKKGAHEVQHLNWEKPASKILRIYSQVVRA